MMYIVAFFIFIMGLVNLNGQYFSDEHPVLLPANRSFRYGDGLFETLKIINHSIALKDLHFDRMFAGLKTLEIEVPFSIDQNYIEDEILMICDKNGLANARVRLSVWSGEGAINNPSRPFNYLIECSPLTDLFGQLNNKGITLGLFENGLKSIDSFSNLKSASFLVYSLASKKAADNYWDNCIILNSTGRIADTTNANIFLIKDERIYTPPLQDGCVAGVMRRFILENLAKDYSIIERTLTIKEIEQADEIFLTNAIRNIQWVKRFNETCYSNQITKKLFDHFIRLYNDKLEQH